MLRDLTLRPVYRSEDDNILEDFYIPALSESVFYRRAVGYFSATMLSYAAQGISALIENEGKIQLIFGGDLSEHDAAAIERGYEQRDMATQLGNQVVGVIDSIADKLCHERLETLSWLVASGRLEIKMALRRRGMYHEKIGILTDELDDFVVFQGSVNETASALLQDYNFESMNVFPGWNTTLKPYYQPFVDGFERLWSNQAKETVVLPFPEAARQKLIRIATQRMSLPNPEIERLLAEQKFLTAEIIEPTGLPTLPKMLGDKKFKIRSHQTNALNAWRSNDFHGILALATGSGKTITAIYGVTKLYAQMNRLVVVIAVPYQNLADQWCEVLSIFNICAIRCYSSRSNWETNLRHEIELFQSGASTFLCSVVVNRTLNTNAFQRMIHEIPGDCMVWIGDECHHHAGHSFRGSLPDQAKMRLGLSATPEHYIDSDANDRLLKYYGPIVSEFTLADALTAQVITPYDYYVHLIDLSPQESEDYIELSKEISVRIAWSKSTSGHGEDQALKALLMKRSRLIGAARDKLVKLDTLLRDNKAPKQHTLFYCGDGATEDEKSGETLRQIEGVTRLLHKHEWRTSRFTSRESRQDRQIILDHFRVGDIDALVAIRCLDEGIDVPACRTAFLLASARNPRQFIQRRGRILRQDIGKTHATIHDFVVNLPVLEEGGNAIGRLLLENELRRVGEFASLAQNHIDAIRQLMPILEANDLVHILAQ